MRTTLLLSAMLTTSVGLSAEPSSPAKPGTGDKTLVSWVTLTDRNLRAGSVLTVQRDNAFDGIIFAELEPGKWMAGSDSLRRTQKAQAGAPAETPDGKALLQMAIVYEGNRISIFRNGEPYASYEAQNIDLLSGTSPIAVFGLRHVGGNGSIGGSIEDARVYNRALGVEELKALKPNEKSVPEPWAWWDFENGQAKDRTGRFPEIELTGGAKVADGKLILGADAALVAGQPQPPDPSPAWPSNPPPQWLTFHLAHPGPGGAFPGDPNPIFFYKGRYHLHYIYNHRGCSFGHVSSTDMVHWKWHPTVLTPRTTGHGMFSGTGFFTKDGRPAMIYHGQGSGRNWIAYGLDDTLDKWSKPEAVVAKEADGRVAGMNQWDPDCWLNGDTYYATSGGRDPHLMKSDNLKDWRHLGLLLHDAHPATLGVPKNEDISCGNVFKIGNPSAKLGAGKWMLLCISHPLGCRYYLGDFKDEKYLPDFHAMMSWNGNNYFAPESVLTPDGRRVMWAWLMGLPIAPTGVQSLPRELELPDDGVLRIRPLRELQSLRFEEKAPAPVTVKAGTTVPIEEASGDARELKLDFNPTAATVFGLDVLCDAQGAGGVRIAVDTAKKVLRVGKVNAPFELKAGEALTLRVFVDKNLVEVFANDRQAAVAAAAYAPAREQARLFAEGADVTVKTTTWKIKSIYEGDSVFKPGNEK